MIRDDGWARHCIWEHSRTVHDLYRRRCRREAEEMTAHAQAAELLLDRVVVGDTLLDAGCGSGYFYHSLVARNVPAQYWGFDAAPSLVEIGRAEMPAFGLPAERLHTVRLEDVDGEFDHVVCINVLSNIDNYHRPLERLLRMARKTVILRESLTDGASYSYVRDDYLDEGVELNVHVNHYDRAEITEFIRRYEFTPQFIEDRRSGGRPELVIGYPHHWAFVLAERV